MFMVLCLIILLLKVLVFNWVYKILLYVEYIYLDIINDDNKMIKYFIDCVVVVSEVIGLRLLVYLWYLGEEIYR